MRALSHRPARTRWLIFSGVGTMGLLVQLTGLWILRDGLGMPSLLAASVAIELAVVHNFAWHFHWTWADRFAAPADLVRRLVRFNLSNGAISIAGNLLLMGALLGFASVHYLLANLISVAACSLVNFFVCDVMVFKTGSTGPCRPPSAPRQEGSRIL